MTRPPRPRGALHYDKWPMVFDELVDRLASRGLEIPDADSAARYLCHIGYYRLSPYTILFQQGRPDHLFRKGTEFDYVLNLYVFDRALRLFVMDALERVEVVVHAALTDHMSTTYDDPHWYTDASLFRDRGKHGRLLRIVRDTCEERLRETPDTGEDSLVHRYLRVRVPSVPVGRSHTGSQVFACVSCDPDAASRGDIRR
ncbi:Abi family protein [Saccharopolyspora hattusasensis]|uniref:Abi family protein n=1 Tax=Saccharopolyspora hattusasensis TaxID=1128679 RepID=UPI003D99D289